MTHPQNFIQIDETLTPSQLQWVVWGSFLLGVIGIIWLLTIPLSYRLLLGFLAVLCVWLNHVTRLQLVALSTINVHSLTILDRLKRADIKLSKPLALDNIEWQLAVKPNHFTHTPSQLWQGYLLQAMDTGKLLIITVCIIEPQVRQCQFTIWQDQCDTDTWRQLKALTNLIKSE